MFRLIAITSPDFWPGEAQRIVQLLAGDFQLVHLRKPGSDLESCAALLASLPEWCQRRIVVHDHFELRDRFPVHGLHLNGRHPDPPAGYSGHLSCSCHSLEEVAMRKPSMDYVFLSPIFDSISKKDYSAAFTAAQLDDAAARGIIDHKVVALGGITLQRIPQLHSWHFGGAAMLGSVW